MELINNIINELVDTEKSLASSFLKAKVLASQIENHEWLSWIDGELEGYSKGNVPLYRQTVCAVFGYCISNNYQIPRQPLVTQGLPKDISQILYTKEFTESIEALEKLTK